MSDDDLDSTLPAHVEVDAGRRSDDVDALRRVIFASEALRDLELVAVAASPAARDAKDPASPFHAVTLAACAEPLRGTGRMRRLVLEWLLAGEMQNDRFSLTENELLVECGSGTYRIHLNAGLVRDPAGRVIDKRGRAGIVLPWLPMEATGILARIVRVALSLR
jgi:hypothetical protein